MGADIHFVIERKDKNYGWIGQYATDMSLAHTLRTHNWNSRITASKENKPPQRSPFDALDMLKERDYTFFANLAGVRGDGPKPNGVPDDVSVLAKRYLNRWGADAHSACHYSLNDFVLLKIKSNQEQLSKAAAAKLMNRPDIVEEFLGEEFIEEYDDPDDNDFTLDANTRVIVWFDN